MCLLLSGAPQAEVKRVRVATTAQCLILLDTVRRTSASSWANRIPDSGVFALAVLGTCPQIATSLPEVWSAAANARANDIRLEAVRLGGFPKETFDYETALKSKAARDGQIDHALSATAAVTGAIAVG